MKTSNQNFNNLTNRPTVEFYFLVIGWRDDFDNVRVKRTKVYTNKQDAVTCYRNVNLWRKTDFVNLYVVGGRTSRGLPDFKTHTRPLLSRTRAEKITRG